MYHGGLVKFVTKEKRLIKSLSRRPEPKVPIASDMFLPNLSGDHSAGQTGTPSTDLKLANKKYVDDQQGNHDLDAHNDVQYVGGPSTGHILAYGVAGVWFNDTISNLLYARSKILYFEKPTNVDDFPMLFVPDAVTIEKVWGQTDTGTVTFMLKWRTETSPGSGGTDILSSSMVADSNGETTTSFDDATIPANSWIIYDSSAVASAPQKLWVAIKYSLD